MVKKLDADLKLMEMHRSPYRQQIFAAWIYFELYDGQN